MTNFPSFKRKRVNSENGESEKKAIPLPRLRVLLLLLILVASVALNFVLFKRLLTSRSTLKAVEKQKQAALVDATEPADAMSESPQGVWYGLCKKNSIHSVADFRATVNSDPLLAAHFVDIDWDKARMGRLDEDIYAHLAYRKNERIWTTRRKIRLPKGDGYITDGNRWIRTFCCNDYVAGPGKPSDVVDADVNRLVERADSSHAAKPVSLEEGIDTDLNRFVERADSSSKVIPNSVPPGGNRERIPVPEPATLLLAGAGATFFGLFRKKRK